MSAGFLASVAAVAAARAHEVDLAYVVSCPTCRSVPGELCRAVSGHRAGRHLPYLTPHDARVELAAEPDRRPAVDAAQGWAWIELARAAGAVACGSAGGYRRHRVRGERACQPCLVANAQRVARWRTEHAAAHAAALARDNARRRALARLAGRYARLFDRLFAEELAAEGRDGRGAPLP